MAKRPAKAASQPTQEEAERQIYVGSFALETLTTGMYTEPLDCIREYVQNAYDAIEGARHLGILGPAEGSVKIIVDSAGDKILIKDDGVSISSDTAWKTLTSVGASKKSRRTHAGFRGIGRLAGIAYCRTLTYRCKAPGETVETIVVFKCDKMREYLAEEGGGDLLKIFAENIAIEHPAYKGAKGDHFTEVTMSGLGDAPETLRDVSAISDYLKATAPIEYTQGLVYPAELKRWAAEQAFEIRTVSMFIGESEDELDPLYKPYGSAVTAGRANENCAIEKLHFLPGGAIGENGRWWGWYADLPFLGQVSPAEVAGIRIRVKNIQLDSSSIVRRLFSENAESDVRFWKYFVGEIFIESDRVIPNARRDGFENTKEWRDLQEELCAVLRKLIKDVRELSDMRSDKSAAGVNRQAEETIREIEKKLASQGAAGGDAPPSAAARNSGKSGISRSINAALKKVEGALERGGATEEDNRKLREHKLKLTALAKKANVTLKVSNAKAKSQNEALPYRKVLDIVYEVLSVVLDTQTFNRARRALEDRFKNFQS